MKHILVERNGGIDATNVKFAEGPLRNFYCILTVLSFDDELCNHRVIKRWNSISGVTSAIHTDIGPPWRNIILKKSWRRHKVV